MKKNLVFSWLLFFLIFIIDRFTKIWALHNLQVPLSITNWFSFELMLNRGVSLGLLHFEHPVGFFFVGVLILSILCFIIMWAWRVYRQGGIIVGQLLVIVGGLSNLIDRIYYGGVVDFIAFSLNGFYFPLFNIADLAIDVGVLILILQNMRNK